MTNQIMSKAVRDYLRRIGAKGGAAKGASKVRGGKAHYASMARKRWRKPESDDAR